MDRPLTYGLLIGLSAGGIAYVVLDEVLADNPTAKLAATAAIAGVGYFVARKAAERTERDLEEIAAAALDSAQGA